MKLSIIAAVAAALGLSNCIYVDGDHDDRARYADRDVRRTAFDAAWDTVYGVRLADDALYVRVASNGCTETDDFDVTVRERFDAHDRAVHRVALRREDRDDCDNRVAGGEELRFDFRDLDIPPGSIVVVTNPLKN